jgi:hypothetical protein
MSEQQQYDVTMKEVKGIGPQQQEQLQRQALFERQNPKVEDEATRLARVEREMREVRITTTQNLEATYALAASQAEIYTLSKKTVDTQEKHTDALTTIKTVTKDIALKADKILQITSSIKKDTETLKKAWRNAGPAGVAYAVLTNERILLVTYFLAHPSFPITTETFMAAWVLPLIVNRTVRGILWGDVDIQLNLTIGAMAYNFLVSQAAIILLLHTVTKQYIELRETKPIEYSENYPGGPEKYMFDVFQWAMNAWKTGEGITTFTSSGPDSVASNTTTVEAVRASVEKFIDSSGYAWNTINQICPTLIEDKAKFATCLTDFIVPKIIEGASTITPNVTGYAAQIGAHLDAENVMLGYLITFLGKMASLAAGKTGPLIANGISSLTSWVTTTITSSVAAAVSNLNPFSRGPATVDPTSTPTPTKGWFWGGQQQLQLLEERQISADETLQSLYVLKSAARMYLLFSIAEDYGNLKIDPIVRESLETTIYYETLLLCNPSITKTPIFDNEYIDSLMTISEDKQLLGGFTRSRRTRIKKTKKRGAKHRRTYRLPVFKY